MLRDFLSTAPDLWYPSMKRSSKLHTEECLQPAFFAGQLVGLGIGRRDREVSVIGVSDCLTVPAAKEEAENVYSIFD